jgi:hypothetical protein
VAVSKGIYARNVTNGVRGEVTAQRMLRRFRRKASTSKSKELSLDLVVQAWY